MLAALDSDIIHGPRRTDPLTFPEVETFSFYQKTFCV